MTFKEAIEIQKEVGIRHIIYDDVLKKSKEDYRRMLLALKSHFDDIYKDEEEDDI